MKKLWLLFSLLVVGVYFFTPEPPMSAQNIVTGRKDGFNCVVAVSTATTVQAVGGACAAPSSDRSIYITDIEFGSSAASGVAADSFPTLKSGTGTTCGTGTAVIWQALTAANTTQVATLSTPIRVAKGADVCWIMTTGGSKTLQIHGFYGAQE